MNGISITTAPCLRSSADSAPAWCRARPTSTRMPLSGRFDEDAPFFIAKLTERITGRKTLASQAVSLPLLLCSQALLAHQARRARDCGILRHAQRLDDVVLLFSIAVLTELELGLELGYADFKSHNVAQHAFAIRLAQARPLLGIGRLESRNELVQNAQQVVGCRKHTRIAVRVDRSIVPRRHDFACGVVLRRDVCMWPVKDCQALRLLLQVAPMRIGFSHMPSKQQLLAIFANDERKVCRKG